MDSDADVGDGVGAGDRKSSKSVASTSVSQPKPMIVKTDCPTGPHFGMRLLCTAQQSFD